jgi:hypothetical protein
MMSATVSRQYHRSKSAKPGRDRSTRAPSFQKIAAMVSVCPSSGSIRQQPVREPRGVI